MCARDNNNLCVCLYLESGQKRVVVHIFCVVIIFLERCSTLAGLKNSVCVPVCLYVSFMNTGITSKELEEIVINPKLSTRIKNHGYDMTHNLTGYQMQKRSSLKPHVALREQKRNCKKMKKRIFLLMVPLRIELRTFCVWSKRDNLYTMEPIYICYYFCLKVSFYYPSSTI